MHPARPVVSVVTLWSLVNVVTSYSAEPLEWTVTRCVGLRVAARLIELSA